MGWGVSRELVKDKKTGEERPVIRTNASTEGWKVLELIAE